MKYKFISKSNREPTMNSTYPEAAADLMGRGKPYDDSFLRKRVTCLCSGLLLCFIIGGAGLGVSIIVLLKFEGSVGIFPQYAANQTELMKAMRDQIKQLHKQVDVLKSEVVNLTPAEPHNVVIADVGDGTFDIDSAVEEPFDVGNERSNVPTPDHSMHEDHKPYQDLTTKGSKESPILDREESPIKGNEEPPIIGTEEPPIIGTEEPPIKGSEEPMSHHEHHQNPGHDHHAVDTEKSTSLPMEENKPGHDHHAIDTENITSLPMEENSDVDTESQTSDSVDHSGHAHHFSSHNHHGMKSSDKGGANEAETKMESPSINELLCDDSDHCKNSVDLGSGIEGSGDYLMNDETSEESGLDDLEGSGDCLQYPRPVCPMNFGICYTNDPCPIPMCCRKYI